MTPDRPHTSELICWSCQCGLTLDITVFIGEGEIPCCTACWEKLPVAERLKIGQMFVDRQQDGVIEAVRTVFRSAFGQFVAEKGGHDWLRGRDGN